jgi:hypothetical protein
MTITTDYIRLLQIAPSLGAGLNRQELADARRLAVVPAVALPAGEWEAGALACTLGPGGAFGGMIADGVVAHDLVLAGRAATYLLGRGDIIAPAVPPHQPLPLTRWYGVADATRVALLGQSFTAVVHRWPAIAGALLVHAHRQMERLAVQQLIGHLPRAEQRIVAVLWHLAARWGRPEGDGVVVPLTLDHEAISHLVDGRRPTISAALGALADQDLVTRLANGTWWLASASRALLDHAPAPTPTPHVHLLGARSAPLAESVNAPR